MVVAVVAADVVESNSSSSGVDNSTGTAVSPSFVGATQDTVVNNNYTDKDNTTTRAGQTALDDSVSCLPHSRDTQKNLIHKTLKINPSAGNINNITNNNMTDAAKGTTTTESSGSIEAIPTKSAVSQRNVDIKIERTTNMEAATQQLTKKVLKLDLGGKNLDEYSLKSPKSPIAARLPHQTSITSSVDVEDRKTLREALYQGIFHRHRRTIFAVGSFLRMLRSRNSQYNTIRSSSEGEDIDEQPKHHPQELEQSLENLQPPGQEVTTIYATSSSGQQGQSDSL
ncbi:uncharacterized protein LOC6539098 isoform X1 [Drosophila yakuba]|uniref:Uncharacterized protein, isoform C n=1 Tax=Drosophila yakuba TaxID=7245 RepID=A0A0R1ED04_DROYA|nr:uncharacterized protein LOC6539098 isoform X1 [Drosophila yakuba]KRK05042.1 uncharacterized protein Dyak_GE15252, isoform C [Drosophila yakuba]